MVIRQCSLGLTGVYCPCGRKLRRHLVLGVCLFFFSLSAAAQTAGETASGNWTFNYKFENKRFYIPLIEIDLAADGRGELRFQRGESDEILDRKVKLLPSTVGRIRQLLETTKFIDSDEDYQSSKDFSHLGWMTLVAHQGGRERKVRFNYTTNADIKEIADIFRGIATQEMDLFEIETSEQYQPLDVPRLLEAMENDLKLVRITEPERLLAKLQEIAGNDSQPLIARNKASQMVTGIKKGKFKSVIRK